MWETNSLPSPSNTQHTQIPTLNGRFSAEGNVRDNPALTQPLRLRHSDVFPRLPRFKNGQPLEDYRIKQKSDALVIRGVTETDAGNYTIFLTNKATKEEQNRTFQLLVNGTPSYSFMFLYLLLVQKLPNAAKSI